jgi:uncharacterized membrane protein YraQ (UPF0718 family)
MNNAIIYISACLFLSALSFVFDRKKTVEGFKRGIEMFGGLLKPFLNILILVSLVLYLIPTGTISHYMGEGSGVTGFAIAALVGAITMIPAFVSYPIAANLIQQGASYAVVATLLTTLLMVGALTLPLEIRYFGRRAAIVRNILNFAAAIIIGLLAGLIM